MSENPPKADWDVNKSWNRRHKRRYSIFDETDAVDDEYDKRLNDLLAQKSTILTDVFKNNGRGIVRAKPHNISELPRILQLPKRIRVKIWKLAGYSCVRNLRLTCSIIQEDIETSLGVSVEIDEDEPQLVDFIESVGIRHATVISLVGKVQNFLINPLLLVELTIHGPISTEYFAYFMEECPNIQRLSIVFEKEMFDLASTFFPQPKLGCLRNLKAIRFSAHTKKESDLIYICDNIIALIAVELQHKTDLKSLHFSLGHKCPSEYLHELLLEIIILAHKNFANLEEFHMVVTDNDPSKEKSRKDLAYLPSVETKDSLDIVGKRRDTVDILESQEEISHFTQDAKNTAVLADATRYLDQATWKVLPKLTKVNICGNSHALGYLHDMLAQAPEVQTLQVEMNGGILKNSWVLYKTLFEKRYYARIIAIKLVGVHHEDTKGKPLNIDFKIFSKFKTLKKLSINCLESEIKRLPKAKGISSLPSGLDEFEASWCIITAWQLFRLLYCFKHMQSLSINYCCLSDSSFGWYLRLIRITIAYDFTSVQKLQLVDAKIKFRNKRYLLKKLTDRINVKVEYQDEEETLLVIDRGKLKTSDQSIPSIESQ